MSFNRIVSLLPSATETICALGREDRIVGISHSCDYPASIQDRPRLSRPRVPLDGPSSEIDAAVIAALRDHGSVYELDVAGISALAPDLVITQGICEVCAVPKNQMVASLCHLTPAPDILTLDAHDLAAVFAGIRELGRVTDACVEAKRCIADIEQRIDAVRSGVATRPRPRVLALEWLDPPFVPGHWVPELIDIAGGELIAGTAGRPSYRVTWEELRGTDPDYVLIMPCGFDLPAARRETEQYAAAIRDVAPRAAAAGRIHPLDATAYFSRSGPRAIDGIEILATIFSG